MLKNTLTSLDKKKLQRWLLMFFFALAIPTAILIQQSYSRLKWETFHQHQLLADELSNRIDSEFLRLIALEDQRSFTDYSFLNIAGNPKANLLQRSPLSTFPIESEITGLIGYFQVDSEGQLLTPLLPDLIKPGNKANSYGIDDQELVLRSQLQNQIQNILSQNSLVKNAPQTPVQASIKAQDELRRNMGARKSEKEEGATSILSGLFGSSRSKLERSSSSSYDSSADVDSGFESDSMLGNEESSTPTSNNTQAAFDRLKKVLPKNAQQDREIERLEELQSNTPSFEEAQKQKPSVSKKIAKRARIEQNVLPEAESSEKVYQKKNIAEKKLKSKALVDASDTQLNNDKSSAVSATAATKAQEIIKQDANQFSTDSLRIRTFESSIDPFEFSQLDSGHFVLFRNVWLNDQRYIQGLLIDQNPFLERIIDSAFKNTSLSQMSDLLVSYQGNTLSKFSAAAYAQKQPTLNGELLHQTRLSDPLSELQLSFSVTQLPVGTGGKIILWLSLLLGTVLLSGFYLMYRLGLSQINLANQQQDFVSAVSHELKTPLTSIRMYSEMLREGWANDEKKKTYYDFIFDESERLSRLINNVLHLARVTRNKQSAELKNITVAELMDGVQSKVSTQIKHAGFEFSINCEKDAKQAILNVDADWFIQIMINLVDNAIKFSAKSDTKKIDLHAEKLMSGEIKFSVRDYGPGVDKTQMKKVFKLFYRTESELTRETVGTGIGLALVHQMTVNMGGKIEVVNCEPGAEFRVLFPINKKE